MNGPSPRKRASIKDVAARAGVSWKTVSNVVNDRPVVKPATRDKVLAAIADLGYVPNEAAREIRGNATRTVALVIPHLLNPYFARLAETFHNIAARAGHSVSIELTGEHADIERRYARGLAKRSFGALIMAPLLPETVRELAEHSPVPTVVLGEAVADHGSIHHVSIDNTASAVDVVRHVIDRGVSRPLFLGAQEGVASTGTERLTGFRAACRFAGIPPADQLLIHTTEWTRYEGYAQVRDLIGEAANAKSSTSTSGTKALPFDAVVAGNDLLALGACEALRDAGYTIGTDVLVCGWDDIPESAHCTPPLTSVAPDLECLVSAALFAALGDDSFARGAQTAEVTSLGSASTFLVPHTLVTRTSTLGH
ncbi:LacI family transcriptional regulator [Dermabacter sp. p3-SID358]|uniref:LacI family DNA-binding transcriptional regulator n=1 Tax=Dermabacter sp. p3-SID358 TaxID=2916114 RepID=UPI0021A28FB8|nr:LacI family DNA-binding transcriptional regulator [Dermabacter sp. p3-SID358]MCT1866305.1 LacI family transcriptional regulator [Dermabacter sp. p3-SID358]